MTGATLQHEHHFRSATRLALFEGLLLRLAIDHGWQLEAWAVFSNHYHFIGHSPSDSSDAQSLPKLLRMLHGQSALEVNRMDGTPGRHVWHNFWETRLTFPASYRARLNYVHQNPVRHGLVRVANAYPWCSAAWFERTASAAQIRAIYRFKIDTVRVADAFQPVVEG